MFKTSMTNKIIRPGTSDEIDYRINDISKLVTKHLTIQSHKLMDKTIKVDKSKFKLIMFAVKVKKENVELGIKDIAHAINELTKQNKIYKLMKFTSFDLPKIPKEVLSNTVYCYFYVLKSQVADIKDSYPNLYTKNGQTIDFIGDIDIPLKEGEFVSIVKLFAFNKEKEDKLLQDEIDKMLSILPQNTSVRSVTQCSVRILSLEYEVVFYNPAFKKDIKEVQLNYNRYWSITADKKVNDLSLLTSVTYLDKDGKALNDKISHER